MMRCPECRSDDAVRITENLIKCDRCNESYDEAFYALLYKLEIVRISLRSAHKIDRLKLQDLDDYFKEHGMSLARFERYLDQILEGWL